MRHLRATSTRKHRPVLAAEHLPEFGHVHRLVFTKTMNFMFMLLKIISPRLRGVGLRLDQSQGLQLFDQLAGLAASARSSAA